MPSSIIANCTAALQLADMRFDMQEEVSKCAAAAGPCPQEVSIYF